MSWVRAILKLKICDTPRWMYSKYIAFAAHLFNASVFLFACPILLWQSVRAWWLVQSLLRVGPTTAPTTQDEAAASMLYRIPLTMLGAAAVFGVVGYFFLRSALKEWRRVKNAEGFQIITNESS